MKEYTQPHIGLVEFPVEDILNGSPIEGDSEFDVSELDDE